MNKDPKKRLSKPPKPYIAVNPGRRYEKSMMKELGLKTKKQLRKLEKKVRRERKEARREKEANNGI